MMASLAVNIDKNGSQTAMNGTESANVIPYLKNGMTEQPATLPSHFCYAKDERDLRARDGSLDSLPLHHATPLRRLA